MMVLAALSLTVLVERAAEPARSAATAAPAAQQEPVQAPPAPGVDGLVSLDRVRRNLAKPPRSLIIPASVLTPTFRTEVRRLYMPDFKEHLHHLFELNQLQRQSADWASRGQGINLLQIARGIKTAFREWDARRIHDQVTDELEALRLANAAAGLNPDGSPVTRRVNAPDGQKPPE